ncbi:DNA-packaging protein [Lactobacillus sp. SL9-6]|nr:DNA-packaging protein [Lactobacillus sp. SL9-6]
MDELHIDQSPAEIATVQALITEAQTIIDQATDSTGTNKAYQESPIYTLAIKTLVQQLYYDRSLTGSFSKGLIMMLDYLEYQRLSEENGTE